MSGPRQVIGHVRHVADPVNRALAWLAGRFDAAHALRADRCRVRGVRREDHLVSRAELDVTAGGVEHDPDNLSSRRRQILGDTLVIASLSIPVDTYPP
jgi:hypothetical protein